MLWRERSVFHIARQRIRSIHFRLFHLQLSLIIFQFSDTMFGSSKVLDCQCSCCWIYCLNSFRMSAALCDSRYLSLRVICARQEAAEGDHVYPHLQEKKMADSDSGEPGAAVPPVTVPPALTLQDGDFARHLAAMNRKRQQLQKLQESYNSLFHKVQSWRRDKGWAGVIHSSRPDGHLLTLHSDRVEHFPSLAPVEPLSQDMLLPLTPTDAWKAVAALRHQLIDLQLKLMNTRILVVGGELRMEETDTIYRRLRKAMNKERIEMEETRRKCLLWTQKLRKRRCSDCTVGSRRNRIAKELKDKLEKILTPGQLVSIRTGRKPVWSEGGLPARPCAQDAFGCGKLQLRPPSSATSNAVA